MSDWKAVKKTQRLRGRPRGLGLAALFLATVLVPASARSAEDLVPPDGGFGLPLACGPHRPCILQAYPDQGPGTAVSDFRCGHLSRQGHQGSDFRLRHASEMIAGVAVVAAAGGKVLEAVGNLPDKETDPEAAAAVTDPGLINGNRVTIDHGAGWSTRYLHLRQNSLLVRKGEVLPRGAVLGQVGLSGNSNFPHLHFEVLHQGRLLDPFAGQALESGCDGPRAPSLWSAKAVAALSYQPGGVLDAAFTSEELTSDAIGQGPPRLRLAFQDTAHLGFWATAWALKAGDRDQLEIRGPDGDVLVESSRIATADGPYWVRALTVSRPESGWKAGAYSGTYRLVGPRAGNDGVPVEQILGEVTRLLVVR